MKVEWKQRSILIRMNVLYFMEEVVFETKDASDLSYSEPEMS